MCIGVGEFAESLYLRKQSQLKDKSVLKLLITAQVGVSYPVYEARTDKYLYTPIVCWFAMEKWVASESFLRGEIQCNTNAGV